MLPRPAGVQLQRDFAIERAWLGIGEIHHRHAIQTRNIAVSGHLHEIVVPIAHAHDAFIFRGRPNYPTASVFPIHTGSVVHHFAIDLELHTLGDIRRSWLERRMEKHTAVPVTHAFEAQRELKILIVSFRSASP